LADDLLFVARSYFKSYSSLGGAFYAKPVTRNSGVFGRGPSFGAASYSFEVSETSSRIGELNSRLDRLSVAAKLVKSSLDAANNILSRLVEAKKLAKTLAPGETSGLQPASATGTALSTGPVALTGSVSLAADTAAAGSGGLVLGPVSATGSVALQSDAAASATGTTDIGGISSFTLETSIADGETLTIDTGSGAQTITFGILPGQVDNASDLVAAIDQIDGVSAATTAEGYLKITADDARTDITIGGTADIEAAFGIAEQTHASTNLLSQGAAEGETLTFQVNGDTAQTITFGTGAGEVATLAELQTALSGVSGLAASVDGGNHLTFSADSNADVVTVGGTADAASAFGIEQTSYDPENLLLQGISQGETLTFQLSGQSAQTIAFGTGIGEVATVDELKSALAGLSGITASIDGGNTLSFAVDDARLDLTIGGTADTGGVLGVAGGTFEASNLLDQGISQGETLTFQVSGGSVQTITFGTGSGEVATLDDLETELGSLSGLTVSLDGQNRLVVAGASEDDEITIGGTADIATAFGTTEETHRPNDLLSLGAGQGETLTFYVTGGEAVQTITFGTGAGEVSTLDELNDALSGLTGVTASIDGGNRLTFTAGTTGESVTIAGTADIEAVFGIEETTYKRTGGNGAIVANINAEFEAIASRIDDLETNGLGNPIAGFTQTFVLSDRPGDATSLGGVDLSLDGLSLVNASRDTFASEASVDDAVDALTEAIQETYRGIAGLTIQSRQLEARVKFQEGLRTALTDGKNGLAAAELDHDEARQASLDARIRIGQAILLQGLRNGLGAGSQFADALAQSASGDAGITLFSPGSSG